MREFHQTFEAMASSLQGVLEHVLEGVFVNGLRPNIRAEVRMVMPRRLEELMEFAQWVEDRNWANGALGSLRLGFSEGGLGPFTRNTIDLHSWALEKNFKPNPKSNWSPNPAPQKNPISLNFQSIHNRT